jgi:hypothetical protein
MAEDTSLTLTNPTCGRAAILIPQGDGRARGHLIFLPEQMRRLQGDVNFRRFVDECAISGMPREYFQRGQPDGPLATLI